MDDLAKVAFLHYRFEILTKRLKKVEKAREELAAKLYLKNGPNIDYQVGDVALLITRSKRGANGTHTYYFAPRSAWSKVKVRPKRGRRPKTDRHGRTIVRPKGRIIEATAVLHGSSYCPPPDAPTAPEETRKVRLPIAKESAPEVRLLQIQEPTETGLWAAASEPAAAAAAVAVAVETGTPALPTPEFSNEELNDALNEALGEADD